MKAISIKNPWATLILQEKKKIEYRTWQTSYRGPLLICASKKPTSNYAGYALCIVNLVNIIPNKDLYHWILKDVKQIIPFPVKGKLGLYDIDLPAIY